MSRSILDVPSLAGWLAEAYGLPAGSCELLAFGLNDHYLWTPVEGRQLVARIYPRRWRTAGQVEAECAFITHVKQHGVAAAGPLATPDGAVVLSIPTPEGERSLVLFEYAAGISTGVEHAREYGRAVARLHDAADSFDTAVDRSTFGEKALLADPLATLARMYHDRPAEARFIAEVGRRVEAALEALPRDELAWGMCHNDLHGGNAHTDGSTVVLFDFDFCGPGWRAFELATYRWGTGLKSGEESAGAWTAFLQGYQEQRPLPELELRAVDVFVVMRHLWWIALQDHCASWAGTAFLHGPFLSDAVAQLKTWDERLSSLS